jgi:hypothetical protein
MARRKTVKSLHTRCREARQHLAELLARQAKLEHSRPRTSGKKGAKTRALNKLSGKIRAARGQLTKARNAITAAPSERASVKSTPKHKRSEAAKKGWATRRARLLSLAAPGEKFMPMLTANGVVWINPLGDDRSLLASYWNAVEDRLKNRLTLALDLFDGLSVFDSETSQHLPFITDMDTVLAYHDHFDFGSPFYKARSEVARLAA